MVTMSATGRVQQSGGRGLKATQTYPVPFGGAVATLLIQHAQETIAACDAADLRDHDALSTPITLAELCPNDADEWTDARLGDPFTLAMQMAALRHL